MSKIPHKLIYSVLAPTLQRSAEKQSLLMVLGSMRSGSSMLTNVLTTSSEILGLGEAYVTYDEPRALSRLSYQLFRHRRIWPSGYRYLADKILHDDLLPDVAALARWIDLHVIVLIREPLGCMKSLDWIFTNRPNWKGHRSEQYYPMRLRQIARTVDAIPRSVPLMATTYESLTDDSDRALARMSAFLDLNDPLTTDYEVHRRTGGWANGDGSSNITSGTIQKRKPVDPADFDPAHLAEAREAYDALIEALDARDPGFADARRLGSGAAMAAGATMARAAPDRRSSVGPSRDRDRPPSSGR